MQRLSVSVTQTWVCGVFGLTAVTLEISLQVLRRPLSSRSLCWMTLCMAAALSEPISISWLADNRAVSRVCWWNTGYRIRNQRDCTCHRTLSEQQTFAQWQGLLRNAGLFHNDIFNLKCYLLSVQLLDLLLLCPKDFIQLTHPAEFSLAREKNRCDPWFHVKIIIMVSRTAVDLRPHPFLLADTCRHIPCSHLGPTVRGKMEMNKVTFTERTPTLESRDLMQCQERGIVLQSFYFRESDKNGKAAHLNTEPGAVCFITNCASEFFHTLENLRKEY